MTSEAARRPGDFARGALIAGRFRSEAPLGHGEAGSVYRV